MSRRLFVFGAIAAAAVARADGYTLRVGPGRTLRTIAEAARIARDGDTVEIDAGTYRRDTAVWTQDRLAIRARGGRVRLVADGADAEGKAIWVVRGGQVLVEGITFEGARVAARNGAGIRFERGVLTVRDCGFFDNEMGLLTSNDPGAELVVENSEFARNLRPDGHNHQLYAGSIARLAVRGSWLHSATVGHLLKSRAAVNHVFYNRLADGPAGRASYELEFPNGGVAVVVGNLVQQSAATENPIMISYGAEGWRWPDNMLAMAHNTLLDDKPEGGRCLRVVPGPGVQVVAVNNLVAGTASAAFEIDNPPGTYRDNLHVSRTLLLAGGRPAAAVAPAGRAAGVPLEPDAEYAAPRGTVPLAAPARRAGAFQDRRHARAAMQP